MSDQSIPCSPFKAAMLRWTPPVLIDALRSANRSSTSFSRPWPTWESAVAASSGYDTPSILNRVLEATRQVRDGIRAYERDSVLFDRIEYAFPLLATLLRAALERGGRLCVVDFGGALGSSYRECRPFLGEGVRKLQWSVVEQASFVEAGQREMQTDELLFFTTMHEATKGYAVDVLLLSSVLQYLPDPSALLDEAVKLSPRYIVLDRTIITPKQTDTLHVQRVPEVLYQASYPVWALSRQRLLMRLADDYELLSEHPSLPFPALSAIGASFKGFIFKRRTKK